MQTEIFLQFLWPAFIPFKTFKDPRGFRKTSTKLTSLLTVIQVTKKGLCEILRIGRVFAESFSCWSPSEAKYWNTE